MIPNLPGSGNHIVDQYDPEEGVSHKDHYKCDCGEVVEEHEWIEELKMCKFCYEEHYGSSYTSIDEAENRLGDR